MEPGVTNEKMRIRAEMAFRPAPGVAQDPAKRPDAAIIAFATALNRLMDEHEVVYLKAWEDTGEQAAPASSDGPKLD